MFDEYVSMNERGNWRFSIYQESPVDLSRQHRIRRKEEEEAKYCID